MAMMVGDIMVKAKAVIFESDSLDEAARTFVEYGLDGMVVCRCSEEIVGVVAVKDVLFGLVQGKTTVREVMRPSLPPLSIHDRVEVIEFGGGPLRPVVDESGRLVGVLTKEQHLTAYAKVAQLRLKHLDAIFNAAHNGILSIDAKGRITSINPPAEKMARTTKEEAIGKFLTDVVIPSGLLEVVRTGKGHTEKYRVGKRVYITNRSPIIDEGKVVGAVGVFQDISEIEFISNELETVKRIVNELQTVMEASSDGIAITDRSGMITRRNKKWDALFLGTEQERVTAPLDRVVRQALDGRQPCSMLHQGMETGNIWIVSAVPIIEEDGRAERVVLYVKDMTEMEQLRSELEETKRLLHMLGRQEEDHLIYRAPAMAHVVNIARQAAAVDVTLLLTGESGTGKEELANYIWKQSARRARPFVKVNCGAIPETLMESELFGYEPGAFTGAAKKGKKGYFEQADGGTIFLDEISEIPLHLQVKLLRVLQSMEIMRLGAEAPKRIDVRVIAATNKPLEELVAAGQFRADLFYRLNVMPIAIPPLRDRKEDIPLLVDHYRKRFAEKYQKPLVFTDGALAAMMDYHWPGNVRELVNAVERMFVTAVSPVIDEHQVAKWLHLEPEPAASPVAVGEIIPLKQATAEVERQLIIKALHKAKTYRRAAKLLGVDASTLVRKAQKYGIQSWGGEEDGFHAASRD
ncbi:PAS domain-containing protein [Geobacillus thermoleovorans]|uniref:HTH-type transcriptional regulatory protein TyrR n=3 Tax=Geobacillus TaxID=129337 RepID=A0A2Z3N5L8_GEOTH|nr:MULTISPECIES: sigma-54-dependent Fis family transcriptional regulator [Geobacillus]AWO74196.1 PAS domain-containing protein [Geobacillus thermoleovorans]MED4973041.1 sigma 54-interacting transcriptional regulator [Geobacillus thermoleovorans]OQP12171.1 AAA family ATPase [Geobacillus thermoleovorans]QCK81584.1 PAS domain S-box protein [Geobacillus kaustophilus NBRC 102445]QNU20500.1 sigma 54-interacting transcriptional regulator [Geobacillus thermoleovorans]